MVVVIRHWKHVGDEDFQEHWEQRTFISNLRSIPRPCAVPRAATGPSRTACTGSWTFNSAKTTTSSETATEPPTSRSSAASPSASSNKTPNPKSARESKTKDSEQQPIPTTSAKYSQTPSVSAFALGDSRDFQEQTQIEVVLDQSLVDAVAIVVFRAE